MENSIFTPQLPLWSFQFRSSSKIEVLSRKEMETKIIVKALKEEAFKTALLENPKAAITKDFGMPLPEKPAMEVVEETDTVLYLVLPHNPYTGIPEEELKNTLGMDLEEIAAWVLSQQKGFIPEEEESSARLVAKAWRDASFKKRLLADPALVMEQELDEKMEAGVAIIVLEETPEKIFIVIPNLPDGDLPLSEVDAKVVNLPMVIGSHHFNTSKCFG